MDRLSEHEIAAYRQLANLEVSESAMALRRCLDEIENMRKEQARLTTELEAARFAQYCVRQ